jgi:hypothetical protein
MGVRVCVHKCIVCAHSVHACMNAVYAYDGYSARVTDMIQYTMCFPNHTMNMAKRATVQQTQIRTPLPVNEIANAPSSLYICSNGLGEDNSNKRDTQRRTVAKRVGKSGLPNNDKNAINNRFRSLAYGYRIIKGYGYGVGATSRTQLCNHTSALDLSRCGSAPLTGCRTHDGRLQLLTASCAAGFRRESPLTDTRRLHGRIETPLDDTRLVWLTN